MRRHALPVSVATVALLVAACGGSAGRAHTTTTRTRAAKGRSAGPTIVSAGVIAKAAKLTAAQSGFAIGLTGSAMVSGLQGKVSFSGTGAFSASGGGYMHVGAHLPGLFSLVSPIKTEVIIAGSSAYAQVPASLRRELSTPSAWVVIGLDRVAQEIGLPPAALAAGLTPRTALDVLAADSSGNADAQGPARVGSQSVTLYREALPQLGEDDWLYAWINPHTGLLARVGFSFSRAGEGQLSATVTFIGFGAQKLPPAPASALSLNETLHQLGI